MRNWYRGLTRYMDQRLATTADRSLNLMKHRSSEPSETELADPALHAQVADVIDEVRPLIRADGGDIELVSVTSDGLVNVRLLGACIGCPSSAITLTMGVERTLKEKIPTIQRVICVP